MGSTPARKKSISDDITEKILQRILQERLLPGDKLPPERELAIQFNTNRNTLREAIRNLQTLNLVEARQGDGLNVKDFREKGEINLLPHFLKDVKSFEERLVVVEDLLEFRAILLVHVVRRLASRGSQEQFAEMNALVEFQRLHHNDAEARVRADLALSQVMVKASGSLALRWLFNTFAKVYEGIVLEFPMLFVFTEDYPTALSEVLRLAQDGNAEEAADRMERHLAASDRLILNVLGQVRDLLD